MTDAAREQDEGNLSVNPSTSPSAELRWYETEFSHHLNYLNHWSTGAVTEGSNSPALFGWRQAGKRDITDDLPAKWTSAEKLKFFGSIARRSRWQPDLIAQDIGSKTQADVVEYIEVLERERRILKVFSKPRKKRLQHSGWISGLAPAAREIKESRLKWEEGLAEQLAAKECQRDVETPNNVDREFHLQRVADIAKKCRLKAHEMDRTPEKDSSALRPQRLELLKSSKRQLDEAVENSKLECIAPVVEGVLRACDVNGLRVLDVIVRQAVETTSDGLIGRSEGLETATLQPTDTPVEATPTTIAASDARSFSRKTSELTNERYEQEKERLRYLSQFPVRQLNENQRAEKRTLAKRVQGREKRREKAGLKASLQLRPDDSSNPEVEDTVTVASAPTPSMAVSNFTPRRADDQDDVVQRVNKNADDSTDHSKNQIQALLDLKSHKTHRPDTLEKHIARIAQEEYEKARAEYLARVPLQELTEAQKREKRTLTERIRARERKRLKSAEKAGLVLDTHRTAVLDAPQADIRLCVLYQKKSKRKRADTDDTNDDSESPHSKRLQRHLSEQQRLDYLKRLRTLANPLSEDEKKEMKTLRARIKMRNQYYKQNAGKLEAGVKQELSLRSTSTAPPEQEKSEEISPPMSPDPTETPPEQEVKRKRGRPKKVRPEPNEQKRADDNQSERFDEPLAGTTPSLDGLAGESRRANQFDDNGVGITYFRNNLKRHYQAKTDELAKFIDDFSVEFEMEFRLLLKNDHKVISKMLKESRYTPQLYAFAIRRRMELLDFEQLVKLLERTESEADSSLIDLTQIIESFQPIVENIRRCLELCVELTNDVRLPETSARAITADIAGLALSMVPKLAPPEEAMEAPKNKNLITTPAAYRPRILDTEWVEIVDPSDGLFEEAPLAEVDEDVAAEDDRLDEVDQQQDIIDRLEDEEYEERITKASRYPDQVIMKKVAIPVLQHDVFDWLMYELPNKKGRWLARQKKAKAEMLPDTWGFDTSPNTPPSADVNSTDQVPLHSAGRNLEELRKTLRATIYQHDRIRWQRIKRFRDPMYRLGGVQPFESHFKSAQFIDSSDGEDSETEIEDDEGEDELENDVGDGLDGHVGAEWEMHMEEESDELDADTEEDLDGDGERNSRIISVLPAFPQPSHLPHLPDSLLTHKHRQDVG
ncbi:hypothetical protein QFC19_009199 [Naganishia cerealis]|uniref:Uncharacterized protein n=1 Tax=Naganishia cerealis TaxID=610337 RepID=A0ACC2UWH8_9TREE|nr:hypothetical protein QFC19_009199 [Naganishia cerealis]